MNSEKQQLLPITKLEIVEKKKSGFVTLFSWALLAISGYMLFMTLSGCCKDNPFSKKSSLVNSMNMKNVHDHLVALSDIARPHNNSRSVLNGLNASATYIYNKLVSETDYDVKIQTFEIDMFLEPEPATLNVNGKSFVLNSDFATIQKSGSGSVSGNILLILDGCSASDYKELTGSEILLLSREGPCDYKKMLQTAVENGARAIMMYTTLPLANGPVKAACKNQVNIPVIGLSHGAALNILEIIASQGSLKHVSASISTKTSVLKSTTVNVIATTPDGDDDNIILFGSHLDSVPQGPGINDDGSGASGTLEVAIQFYKSGLSKKTIQKLRFSFWSGEELGLLGSTHYVNDLAKNDPEALKKISVNMNNDMIASPNFIRGVYNGYEVEDKSMTIQCGVLRDLFAGWFEYRGLEIEDTAFNGRSDYGPFLDHKIPAGGLFTGAEQVKTAEQAQKFGGFIGVAYDPCYHSACDTLKNVNMVVMKENVEAMAFMVEKLAFEGNLKGLISGEKELGDPRMMDY